MKNFSTVFNFEFKQFFAKKATKVIMALYFIIAIGITFVPSIANSNIFKGESNDNFNRSAYVVKDVNIKLDDLKEAKKYDSKEALENDIKAKKLDEGIVLTKDSYEYLKNQVNHHSNFTIYNYSFDNIGVTNQSELKIQNESKQKITELLTILFNMKSQYYYDNSTDSYLFLPYKDDFDFNNGEEVLICEIAMR